NTTDPYNTIGISTLTYDQREALATADIQDGAPRFVTYASSLNGEIMMRDTAVYSGNAPHARYYYFNGVQMGDVSDDGTSNVDYASAHLQPDLSPTRPRCWARRPRMRASAMRICAPLSSAGTQGAGSGARGGRSLRGCRNRS
ncbi:MAG TPA: hypothetical protein VG889_09825, partial [Rhizomicrobium sp.]|nr:hypothetical protein [Rhizomicrobium sp.]